MSNSAETRGKIISLLEQAFALADELGDGNTALLTERALDEASSRQFRLPPHATKSLADFHKPNGAAAPSPSVKL